VSKLLIHEPPLQVLPRLAVVIGLNEAIILQQIHYWLVVYEGKQDTYHRHDGRWWVWNTIEEWQVNFPFWSSKTVQRTLTSLRRPVTEGDVQRGPLVLTERYNKKGYDRTLWYTIDYQELNRLEKAHLVSNPSGQSVQIEHANLSSPIPETNQRLTTDPGDADTKTSTPKPVDHLDLALRTKTAQDKRKYPIEHLAGVVAKEFGLAKSPDHNLGKLWEDPISDLLNQADQDVDRVEAALLRAITEGRESGLTLTTPNSLHGMAMKALGTPSDNGAGIQFKQAEIPDDYVDLPTKRPKRPGEVYLPYDR